MARKFVTSIDLTQNELQNAVVQNLTSAPSTPKKGQIYFNSSNNTYNYYDGATWNALSTSTATGNVSQAGNSGGSGRLKVSAAANTTITDYATAGIVKSDASGNASAAVPGTDYLPATSGSAIQKANGSGSLTAAIAGTDYLAPNGSGSALSGITESQVTNLVTDLAAKAPTANPTFTGTVTVPTPVNATDAATKAYVDTAAQGLSAKASTAAVATGNVSLTGTQTIDGVALAAGQRVLLTGQTTASQNGIWLVSSGAWTRPSDFATGANEVGTYVFVEGGTSNASSGWVVQGTGGITVDTTAQTWVQFSGAGEITTGTGITKTGNQISLATPVSAANGGLGVAGVTGLIKGNGASAATAAVAGIDYAAAPTGSTLLKPNGAGGWTSAKYTATIGDGSTTAIAVTHSLGTQDAAVFVRDATTNAMIECDVVFTSASVVTLTFGTAPATGAYKVVVIG
jgi:hypothetical protein